MEVTQLVRHPIQQEWGGKGGGRAEVDLYHPAVIYSESLELGPGCEKCSLRGHMQLWPRAPHDMRTSADAASELLRKLWRSTTWGGAEQKCLKQTVFRFSILSFVSFQSYNPKNKLLLLLLFSVVCLFGRSVVGVLFFSRPPSWFLVLLSVFLGVWPDRWIWRSVFSAPRWPGKAVSSPQCCTRAGPSCQCAAFEASFFSRCFLFSFTISLLTRGFLCRSG